MIRKKIVSKVLKETMENEYWKEVYKTAPTKKMKRYWALSFCCSAGLDGEISKKQWKEAEKEMDKMVPTLGIEEWRHVQKYCGTVYGKLACEREIKKIQESDEK